ncbi:hypothetical protein MB02_12400 [Croceicoccus estronivorus]|uniref:hypothetical protein n=1 Tax=Croceicoccus estronivorus TaxID=1172626 RepID=UPI0008349530|nr:hypothetical protein [Croceicoccus estronivorus]OCC23409.1 hypothetical protein MB02_12400 [Croceicoccus estronivorus]
MSIELHPFGNMLVYPERAIRHAGPLALRAEAHLAGVDWETDLLGKVSMEFGMGTYLQGAYAGHVTVRLALTAGDGTPFFFQYLSVGEMDSHIRGETPIFLTGQIEIDPDIEKYAWLNRVQFVGRGMLTHDPLCQAYEMAWFGERA